MQTKAPTTAPATQVPGNFDDLGAQFAVYRDLTLTWFHEHQAQLVVASAAAVVLFLLLTWMKHVALRHVQPGKRAAGITDVLARTVSRTSRFFRIMAAGQLVNVYADAPWPIAKSISFVFTVALVFQVAIWLRELLIGAIERRAAKNGDQSDTLQSAMALIRVAITFALFAIATIVVLDNVGVNVTGLVAGLGVGGIAIGLAAQGVFSDLFAAIAIIFDQPFKRGDTIGFDTTTARVERIGMKSTRLRSLTGEEKVIANNKLLEKEITNFTELTERRTTFVIGLVYHTPPEKIAGLPDKLAKIVEQVGARFVRAGFTGFGASSLELQLVFDSDCDDYNDVFVIRHALGVALLKFFAKERLELAYPTQTTYSAAPDGTLVLPYAPPVIPARLKK